MARGAEHHGGTGGSSGVGGLAEVAVDPGRVGAAGPDRAARRRRHRHQRDRGPGRRFEAHSDLVEEADAAEGVAGLEDRPKPGRPQQIDEVAIVLATLEAPPERLGVTHWSSRLLGAELGLSNVTIAKVWKRWGLQPWRVEWLNMVEIFFGIITAKRSAVAPSEASRNS